MTIRTTAKCKFFVGTTKSASALADYTADTWTEVTPVENLGEFGAEGASVVFKAISDGYARKLKGTIDSGDIQLVCARDPADAGQIALRAAATSLFSYNFKVMLNDQSTANGATPTIYYFSGPVMSAKNSLGAGDDVTKTTFKISISGQILEVPAT